MENKNNHLSPKPLFLILFILIEVLVVLILPFRFVSASVILLMNLWGVRYWLKMKRWLTLNKREKIQQASTVAETNLAYVSEVMPVGVIAYQPSSQKIEWLNPLALKVKDQSGLTEEELLDQGIKPNTIRLSIGIEKVEDLIAALDAAFEAVK